MFGISKDIIKTLKLLPFRFPKHKSAAQQAVFNSLVNISFWAKNVLRLRLFGNPEFRVLHHT